MEKALEQACIAGEEQRGQRLDAALAVLFPMGLRGRRRLWKGHSVLVDGIARSPAFRLRGGEVIRLVPTSLPDAEEKAFAAFFHDPPRLIARRDLLFFFYKPRGLHTEQLAGASDPSLAGSLARSMPDTSDMPLRLLSRLDQGTSGIVPAAGDEDAARQWRRWERTGGMDKHYLALLEGWLDVEQTARNALDLTRSRRTRVSEEEGPVLRHTRLRPLAHFQAADAPELMSGCPDGARFTMALCRIAQGARHQIRAHAAHIGYPLAGDVLYGAQGGAPFLLHHCRIQWPGGQVACGPSWLASLPAPVREQIKMQG
jgi:23S rRNA pseudouridine1911/1915/1917 synthase